MGKTLGKGTFGHVFKAKHVMTGREVAIKKIMLNLDPKYIRKHLILISRELYILKKLSEFQNNMFTVRLVDAFVNEDAIAKAENLTTIYLVTSYECATLSQVLRDDSELSMDQFLILTFNLVQTIKYLHEAGVVHRDIKPNNILINESC